MAGRACLHDWDYWDADVKCVVRTGEEDITNLQRELDRIDFKDKEIFFRFTQYPEVVSFANLSEAKSILEYMRGYSPIGCWIGIKGT